LAQSEPDRICAIDADRQLNSVQADIWAAVSGVLKS
jgi:thymidylate kinase